MYENKARLLCTAEGTPVELLGNIFTITDAQQMAPRTSSRSRKKDDSDLCVDNELGFAKDRTISRYSLFLANTILVSFCPPTQQHIHEESFSHCHLYMKTHDRNLCLRFYYISSVFVQMNGQFCV